MLIASPWTTGTGVAVMVSSASLSPSVTLQRATLFRGATLDQRCASSDVFPSGHWLNYLGGHRLT